MKEIGKARVASGKYKDFSSITIESASVRIELVPEIGAKLVSILYKPTGKEWLLDSGQRPLRQPEFGSTFSNWDMSGFDECFPTINPCHVEMEEKISLPCHGEVWSIPWNYEVEEDSVVCSVRSPQLPYRLTRRISFTSAAQIRLDYQVENEGNLPLPFLWVPHPQFNVDEPTSILLPPQVQEMLCVYGGHTLQNGELYEWDAISLMSPEITGDGRKFYFPGKVSAGWSGLYGQESGNFLIISVPPDKVPYLGVWMDEGMFNDRATCALEPSIGYYDALDMAVANGTAQEIPPNGSFSWHLNITLGEGDWKGIIPGLPNE
jgi:galactose mutarotase-like enzyme